MPDLTPIISPHNDRIIRDYLWAHEPFVLDGGPGIGKSLSAIALVQELEKLPNREDVLKIDITEDTEVRHLVGEMDMVRYFADAQGHGSALLPREAYFKPAGLTVAAQAGRTIIIEELDRAGRDTLFPVLFDAIEYKKIYVPDLNRTIRAEPGFNIVITVNRFTDSGTVALPKALLRRPRCVRFYDPSKEFGINLWKAVEFEARIVMVRAGEFITRQKLDADRARVLIEELLGRVIFPMRAAHEFEDDPSPAETAMWFSDMCRGAGAVLLADGATDEEQLDICLRYRGALVKTAADDAALLAAMCRYFLEERAR